MTNIRKTIALLLCQCMLWGTAALAEDAAAATDTATTAVTELNDTDVLATVNGEEVSWDEVKSLYSSLVSQYGQRLRPDPAGQCGPGSAPWRWKTGLQRC